MVALFVAAYSFIRLLSFFTYHHPIANQMIAALLILAFAYYCFKNLKFGWLLLVTELLIDGAGHFFELQGLLLRTWFLGIFAIAWIIHIFKTKQFPWPHRSIIYSGTALGFFVLYATLNGFYHHHTTTYILQDAIIYAFLGLVFPAKEWYEELKEPFLNTIKAWVIGSTLFSTITLFIYSSGLGYLPDTYYHWFRNVASGKITDLGNHFFRIVLPEHLLIVPIIIVITAFLIRNPKDKMLWALQIGSALVLALNFSRIYFLALAIGLLALVIKQNFKQWLIVSALSGLSVLVLFSSVHLISSRGQSSGLELLGLRLGGTVAPTADVSGAIRLAILPNALGQIKERPILGSGFGAIVTYLDPATKEYVSRTQFDWGYLEMLVEFGILGTIAFLAFFTTLLTKSIKTVYFAKEQNTFAHGLMAGALALVIINITTPALFHGFGILYFVLMLAVNDVWTQLSSSHHDTV